MKIKWAFQVLKNKISIYAVKYDDDEYSTSFDTKSECEKFCETVYSRLLANG